MKDIATQSNGRVAAAAPSLGESYAAADQLARSVGGNFYYSFIVLSAEQKRSMTALYSFLHRLDAIGDDETPIEEKRQRLAVWRYDLEQALAGHPTGAEPWWPAFADTVNRHSVPPQLLTAVFDGVESDLAATDYATFSDLYRYCYRVASAVGLMCIRIWGATDPAADLPAEHLGIAFQLTNILRDVVEDSQLGRCYLPLETLHRFGIKDPSVPFDHPGWKQAVAFEAERAAEYFELGKKVSQFLPPQGRASLTSMVGIYESILARIRERPERVFEGRIRVPTWRKLLIAAWAMRWRFFGG